MNAPFLSRHLKEILELAETFKRELSTLHPGETPLTDAQRSGLLHHVNRIYETLTDNFDKE